MGLDMAVYEVSRPHINQSVTYTYTELRDKGYIILYDGETKSPLYRELMPYTQAINAEFERFDMAGVIQDYELSDDVFITEVTCAYIAIQDRVKHKTVHISNEDSRRYKVVQIVPVFVTKADEVISWRKEYDIQDWMYEHLDSQIENTGYYLLSLNTIIAFNKRFRERLPAISPDKESALFYWEWY